MEYELLMVNISRDSKSSVGSFKDCIGQYLIASYLRNHHFKAYVFSGSVAKCKKVIEEELGRKKTKLVGFYAASDNIRVVAHAIQWVKKQFPDCKTIVGGPQVIGLDYKFFEKTGNDFAIIGEGEIPMLYLLNALIDRTCDLQDVPSLVMKDLEENKLIVNKCDNAVICDLDLNGYPSMEESLAKDLRQDRIVGIITGRGCPYQCSFCYEGANAKNVRLRSIANVMEEIDYIKEHNPKLEFLNIYDDTFTLNKERVENFCTEIRKRNIKWFCEGHITFVLKNKDIIKCMVDSGLVCIQFGIESGSDIVLDAYNKHTNFETIVSAVKICKDCGIHGITGNFIVGGAFETRESIEKSKELAKILINEAKGIIELYTVYFAPYPNTKMQREPEKFGIKIHEKLKEYNLNTMRSPVVETESLTTNDIYDLKNDFDEFLQEEYEKAAEEAEKSDVLQGLFLNGKKIHINQRWERLYYSKRYISTFLDHISDEEQTFKEDAYIIRTFEDFKIDGEIMVSEVGKFVGLEKAILMNASGIMNASEMSEKFGVSIQKVEEIYYNLNNKCLVYISEF